MRIALLTESAFPTARSAEGGWCDRLTRGLPEHQFELYALGATRRDPVPEPLPARLVALRHSGSGGGLLGRQAGARLGGGLHGPRRRRALAAYRALVGALVEPGGADGFGPALYALAESARGGGLPALLRSGAALDTVEAAWRTPGARGTVGPGSVGEPLVRDALVAVDLLERCLRPLSAPWYGPDGLASADVCHAVDGGLAVLPGLLARHEHGIPLIITEHSLHLRERARGYRTAPYRWPVRALLLAFFRLLAREGYRQAGLITPGSAYDRRWQIHCGADPAAIRVVYEGTGTADRPAAGAEPPVPTLAWSGPIAPYGGLGTMLRAFAELRRQLPEAVLRIHGEIPPGAARYAEGCRELARLVAPQHPGAVVFEDASAQPGAVHRQAGVLVFSGANGAPPRQLAEAMLSGRPVVATDVGAAREVVGPTGLLVPAEDPRALAAACAALLADPERRSRLGNAGRLRAQELYAVEPAATAFRSLYLELVSGWPGPAAVRPDTVAAARQPFGRPADYWVAAGAAPARAREAVPVEAGAG
ncbi:DUF3492 domain-containing protein [Streptacidiphilus sp. PB12-B1b]|uniref:DUF3492 domain-containing protein n=1 Tax=Streptacidiphilus sp. PB12-B1b TaxID=2705012 RepID=UPI0015FB8C9B|nr:DUF3492 domain-containing protein [Streptacidiphilus sp. PB12-B1b]QMU75216.1 DUF3492 domain-containing protein [Streptacidiphilus sp. PB12-B1b]